MHREKAAAHPEWARLLESVPELDLSAGRAPGPTGWLGRTGERGVKRRCAGVAAARMWAVADDAQALISELDTRMRRDCDRMALWRVVHRTTGMAYSVVLIAVPAVLAAGFASSETPLGKALLLLAAVVGGLNVTFKPYLHSRKRRSDVNTMRRLRDEFRAESVREADKLAVYEQYSAAYASVFEARGRELLDGSLGADEGAHGESGREEGGRKEVGRKPEERRAEGSPA
ncbi:hypothetical protein KCV87_01400 [Actinosynnema pretiosum subsp. pretiosum]|uniref:Uncharacterized protein n=1 Tax=Actinosynnema pretiosum subsp. pretiosum TaxID=103721 RepID=A0AA45L848_9PSEU|nr:hypothetical protein APASM_3729 [Actinosynnema pretiosum subsp. pretiosum]QUF04823.1 hypothetical protein KCV87_01400 [Actinosynnema pretiosum subsp. pretiosum]